MIKKLLLSFSLLFLLPQISWAQVYWPDNEMLNINCQETVCLSPLSIKNNTYAAFTYYCKSMIGGNCNAYADKEVAASDPMKVLVYSIKSLIDATSKNESEKMIGYTGCHINPDNNAECNLVSVSKVYNSKTKSYEGRESKDAVMTSFILRSAMDCPNLGKYVLGKGCIADEYNPDGLKK